LYDAIVLAKYSNTESTVLTYFSIRKITMDSGRVAQGKKEKARQA